MWENINAGNYPEYELGIQILEEEDEFKYDFDILDATKIWPEEDFPVKIIGKMTLNRNVDNVFAETEQVALHPGSIVRGIDFTNDPLYKAGSFLTLIHNSHASVQIIKSYRLIVRYVLFIITREMALLNI